MVGDELLDACKEFSTGMLTNCLEHLAEDLRWVIIGDDEIIGIQALIDFNQQASSQVSPRYIINNLIIGDDYVVIEGSDSDQSDYFFCDVFFIQEQLITKITSYVT